ncbi:MAG: hypothetical protein WCG26_02775 [Chloroflexales bacterium]
MRPQFQQTAPDRLVIREGGGCLALFGLPFAIAGIFMLLIGVGIVPMQNAEEVPRWSWPLIVLMGLVFVAAGSSLTFGRSWTILDRSAGSILQQWGLLIPMRHTTLSLSSYAAVGISFKAGDSDSADSYAVSLRSRDASAPLTLVSLTDYAAASERAKELAGFLHLPLEDATSTHPQVYRADQLDEPLQARLRSAAAEYMSVPRPAQLRSQVGSANGALQITIPGAGFRATMLFPFIIPLGFLTYVAPSLLAFFQQTETPATVSVIFLGFVLIFFVALPTIGGLTAIIGSIRGYTQVTVTPVELVIARRGALRTQTTRIPSAEVLGLDYGGSLLPPSVALASGTPAPWWLRALSGLVTSKGITVKSRGGLVTFGAGLPDDEVHYLWAIISSTHANTGA